MEFPVVCRDLSAKEAVEFLRGRCQRSVACGYKAFRLDEGGRLRPISFYAKDGYFQPHTVYQDDQVFGFHGSYDIDLLLDWRDARPDEKVSIREVYFIDPVNSITDTWCQIFSSKLIYIGDEITTESQTSFPRCRNQAKLLTKFYLERL